MFWLSGLILTLFANVVALLIAAYFEDGFVIVATAQAIVPLAFTITLVNALIRPVLKTIFSPLAFITFGISNIVLNAAIIYFIDIYAESLTITGIWPLVLGAHIIGLTNIVLYYASIFVYGQMNIA